ncbi:hypothetical protein MSM1_19110 [Mycobacterium sp. SM1]|uniref:hypothetical protein n=1 Tax=Mycobacterium sp. SM1 TaxID=2816243 RepID=UPI001BD053A5|nr:hypothetical protein [Mycobacterium sp. SM1]MBS4730342.1 hypothetical protein [Mycobacterium sp. SM1]
MRFAAQPPAAGCQIAKAPRRPRNPKYSYDASLNPAAIARQIADLQATLLKLAKDKTDQLYLAAIPTALPDVKAGIRVKRKAAS